jgi:hypothetical protein
MPLSEAQHDKGDEMQTREGRTAMTRKEKDKVVDGMLDRYHHLGALLVGDDESLCRLLTTLEIGAQDHEIGDYLSSFITV